MFTGKIRTDALDIFLEFYNTHRGTSAGRLCQQLGVRLVLKNNMHPCAGLLREQLYGWVIYASLHARSTLREFVVFHELAHLYLRLNIPNLTTYRCLYVTTGAHQEEECWCDSFALSMLFYQRGVEIVSVDNLKEFFTSGVGSGLKDQLNAFQGERIDELCRNHFVDPPWNLVILGKTFSNTAVTNTS